MCYRRVGELPWRNWPKHPTPVHVLHAVAPKKTARMENMHKNDASYYAELQNKKKYEEYVKENEFLTIPEVLDAVNTRGGG